MLCLKRLIFVNVAINSFYKFVATGFSLKLGSSKCEAHPIKGTAKKSAAFFPRKFQQYLIDTIEIRLGYLTLASKNG